MNSLEFYAGVLGKLTDMLEDEERADALFRVYVDETDAIARRTISDFLAVLIDAIPMSQKEIARR